MVVLLDLIDFYRTLFCFFLGHFIFPLKIYCKEYSKNKIKENKMHAKIRLKPTDVPIEDSQIYKDSINEYVIIYRLMSDPKFLILNKNSKKVFLLCNGKNTVYDIISELKNEECLESETLQIINRLCEEKVLKIKDLPERKSIKRQIAPRSLGIWLHITNSCNLRCSYCYINKDKGHMPLSIAKKTIMNALNQCKKYDIPHLAIKFAGGEPLIVWGNILHIINFTKKQCNSTKINPSFSIISNGTLINKDIAQYLSKNKIPISISLDGLGNVNDEQRFYANKKGSFHDVERGIKILKEVRWNPFILITVTERNFKGLRKLTKYLLKNSLSFRYSLVRSCEKIPTNNFLSSQQHIKIFNQCFDDIEKWMLTKNWNFNVKFCDINPDRHTSRICGIGKNSVAIDYNGEIAICQMIFNESIGNINSNLIIETVRNQKIITDLQEKTINNYPVCNQCEWKNVCAGGCPVFTYKQFGTISAPSPHCSYFKQILPRIIRLEGIKLIKKYENSQREGGETNEKPIK